MSEAACVAWYRNWPNDAFKHTYASALDGVLNNPTFLAQIRRDHRFFEAAFPTQALDTASKDYSALYTEPELTKRALTLYTLILHRFGFKLYDPQDGSFVVLEQRDNFTDVSALELLSNKVTLQENGTLLERVLRSLVLIGYPHYTIYLHNTLHRLFLAHDTWPTKGWMLERLNGMVEDLIMLDKQHKKAGTETRFSLWLKTWRRNDFRLEMVAREHKPSLQQQPIEIGARKAIHFCEHGVYMRTAQVNGSSQKMFLCLIEVQQPGTGHACSEKYACR